MDEFIMYSNACLNKIVDHIGSLDNKSDIRKYNDVYQHLMKLQRAAITSEDEGMQSRFKREWAVCEPTMNGEESGDYDDEMETPTQEQLEEFKKTVAAWFQLDDEEKELRRKAAERKMLKGRLTTGILNFMQRFDIEDLKTRDGNLRMFKREVKKLPSKSVQMERIQSFFNEDTTRMEEFKKTVFESERVETCGIRRLKI